MTARRPRSRVAAPVATLAWAAGLVVLALGLLVLAAVAAVAAVLPGSGLAVAVGGALVVLLA
ncbi:MAG: hypothetical protein QOG60_1413, partial [Frankiaceae bacterium]|nr:hypothetical protein [Frankiaceae bacterium]